MKKISASYLIAILAFAAPTAALAQAPNWSQQGDYYAPSGTIVQQASPQDLREFRDGDYYVSGNTAVQQPTARQLRRFRQGDYYAPEGN